MISLVIPTLNEVENIPPLLACIMHGDSVPDQIVFVDDGSTDGTRECIRSFAASAPVHLIERDVPSLGLAGAVVAGARAAKGEWLIVMDADLSHPPQKIVELLRPLTNGKADMAIGSRYVKGGSMPSWSVWRRILSRLAASLAYPLTGVHDSMSGFFAIRRTLLLELTPAAAGFKIAFEAIVHGGKNLRVLEIPIVFRDRAHGISKMSLGVALLFAGRWLAAMTTMLFQGRPEIQGTAFPTLPAAPFARQSSIANPMKSSSVANSAFP